MKILFDMSSATSSSSSSATSVRDTIISYTRALLPSLPSSFYDFVPFTLAAIMALLFTALLVLLVEDSDDTGPNGTRITGDASTTSHKSNYRSSKRIIGLAERDKDAESGDEEWDASPWDPRADLDPTSRGNIKQSQSWMAIQNEKIATSHGYRTTSKWLLASPPSSASPQSPAFTPPMLSMAKLIMHRHDQSSKRARSSKGASLPPSPPPAAASTSFGSMQYTLKSATLKNEKLALVAFPSPDAESTQHPSKTSSPPHRSTSDNTEKGSSSHSPPPSNTRHARNRSVALPSISLPSISSIPALIPALQLLQSKPSLDRALRRRPSSLLEEGGSSEPLPTRPRKSSSISTPSISEKSEVTNNRLPEALVELEKGHGR